MPRGKFHSFNAQVEFVTLWQNAATASEVAERLGVSTVNVVCSRARWLREKGVPLKHFSTPIEGGSRGDVLTRDDLDQLRALAMKLAPKAVA